MPPLSGKQKAGQPFKTPPRPRADSNLARRNSPRASVTSLKEVTYYLAVDHCVV